MPGTMQASFGRVMSGRFVPGAYSPSDVPSASFPKDWPQHGITMADIEVLQQQAKLFKPVQLLPQGQLPQQPSQQTRLPHPSEGKRPSPVDGLEKLASAPPPKRPRLTIPDLSTYGRSVSDPPMSLQRRLAHAADLPIDVLKGKLVFPSQTEQHYLRPSHSGPAKLPSGRAAPYRIYSNAFQGGRGDTSTGPPFTFSQDKGFSSHLRPQPSGLHQSQNRPGPTPHPAFLRQPLPSSLQGSQQQSQQVSQNPLQLPHEGLNPAPHHEVLSHQPSQGSMPAPCQAYVRQSPDGGSLHSGMTASLQGSQATHTHTSSGAGRHPLAACQQLKPTPPPHPHSSLHNSHSPHPQPSAPSVSTESDSGSGQGSASVTQSMSHGCADSRSFDTAEGSNQAIDIAREPTLGADLPDRLRAEASAAVGTSTQDVCAKPQDISARPVESRNSPSTSRAPPESALPPLQNQAEAMQRSLPHGPSNAAAPSVRIVLRPPESQPPPAPDKTALTQSTPASESRQGQVRNSPIPEPGGSQSAFQPRSSDAQSEGTHQPAASHPRYASGTAPSLSTIPSFPSLLPKTGASSLSQTFPPNGDAAQSQHSHSVLTGQSHLSHFGLSQQPSQHPSDLSLPPGAVTGGVQGGLTRPPGGPSQAQLQVLLGGGVTKDEHREEAMLGAGAGASAPDSASIAKWLQAQDPRGKAQKGRSGMQDPRTAATQGHGALHYSQGIPNYSQGLPGQLSGVSSQLASIPSYTQGIPGYPQGVPGLRAPVQAQLRVMRDSFNRITGTRSMPGNPPPLGQYTPPGVPSSVYTSAAFPSLTHPSAGYPLGHAPSHDQSRFASPASLQDSQIPRMGSAGSVQEQHGLQTSHSSLGRSSLPPSVSKYLAELEQHQAQQPGNKSNGLGPGSHDQSFLGTRASLLDQPRPTNLVSAPGMTGTSRPLDSVRISGRFENLGSGFSLPSKVLSQEFGPGAAPLNPALLNRPLAASHRDPHPQSQEPRILSSQTAQAPHDDAMPRLNPLAAKASTPYHGPRSQHASHGQSLSPGNDPAAPLSSSFPPSPGSAPQPPQLHSIPPAVQALAALLSNSRLSSSDVAHLQSLANSQETGNLGQLAVQLEMAIQLAQSQTSAQSQSSAQLPEPTHRIRIPAAQLKERSAQAAARVASAVANLPSLGAVAPAPGAVAPAPGAPLDGRSPSEAGIGQQVPPSRAGRKKEKHAPASGLDIVAEAAAAAEAEAVNEPSELLMLAAETLAGLNSFVPPRPSIDHSRTGTASLEHSSNEAPPVRKSGKYKHAQEGAPKPLRRRYKPYQRPSVHADGAAAASGHGSGHASPHGNGSAVHPVLGLYVPHARRSYHRDAVTSSGAMAHPTTHHNGVADLRDHGMPTAQPAVHAKARKGPSNLNAAKPHASLRRMPSDSSMTVSASSNPG